MMTAEEREELRRQAMERIRKLNRVEDLAVVTAKHGHEEWPVRIQIWADQYFCVSGRSTRFDVYITETNVGLLVSIPNHNRCGHIPKDFSSEDVMNYLDIGNLIDAKTLAVGIRRIIRSGLVPKHPEVSMGNERGA